MTATLIAAYLDRVNNFLTLECFAEHYGISEEFARHLIAEGKRLHEQNVELLKQ